MIIAVEGCVHTGKTTYINNFVLKNKDFVVVPECLFDGSLNPVERQNYYLNQEIDKKIKYNQNNLILDRCFLSTLCYTSFTSELTDLERKNLYVNILSGIVDKKYILPDKILFMHCDWDIIVQNHLKLKKEKQTQDILAEKRYFDYYNNTFGEWFKGVPVIQEFNIGERTVKIYEGANVIENVKLWIRGRL